METQRLSSVFFPACSDLSIILPAWSFAWLHFDDSLPCPLRICLPDLTAWGLVCFCNQLNTLDFYHTYLSLYHAFRFRPTCVFWAKICEIWSDFVVLVKWSLADVQSGRLTLFMLTLWFTLPLLSVSVPTSKSISWLREFAQLNQSDFAMTSMSQSSFCCQV